VRGARQKPSLQSLITAAAARKFPDCARRRGPPAELHSRFVTFADAPPRGSIIMRRAARSAV
jgi:hypothetical protein